VNFKIWQTRLGSWGSCPAVNFKKSAAPGEGDKKEKYPSRTLSDLGVSKKLSSTGANISAVPEKEFDAHHAAPLTNFRT